MRSVDARASAEDSSDIRLDFASMAGLAGVLGDAPTRLKRQLREHPLHEPNEVPTGLHPREPSRDPVEELTFQHRPQAGLYAVARSHRVIF
jgi:hypothetical protein